MRELFFEKILAVQHAANVHNYLAS